MVNWTEPAKEDLRKIHEFIRQDSVYYAEEIIELLAEATAGLSTFPYKGRIVPELKKNHN